MYPAPSQREMLPYTEHLPEDIQAEYQDTLAAFNYGLWSNAAAAARRTLEAIAYELLPVEQHKGRLHELLRALPKYVDTGAPIEQLAYAVKDMGNKGAHVDRKVKHNRRSSEALLDALEFVVEYFFTLPRRIDDLKTSVTAREVKEEP